MPTREALESALINADKAGDVDAAKAIALALKQQMEPSALDKAAGAGEVAMSIASGAVAEPIAGIAGLVAAPAGAVVMPGLGADVVEKTREALTYNPRTEQGKRNLEAIGGSDLVKSIAKGLEGAEARLGDMGYDVAGPMGGAMGEMIPTAIIEALGLGVPGKVGKVVSKQGERASRITEDLTQQAKSMEDRLKTSAPDSMGDIAETLTAGSRPNITEAIQADPKFYQAADELGLSTEPLASFASKNPQFRAIEMGLSSLPASQLATQEKAFITDVSRRADNLIREYGGTLDKAELSDKFRDLSGSLVADLSIKADDMYNELDRIIIPDTPVKADNTVKFIQDRADELGGISNLPPRFRKLLMDLGSSVEKDPGFDLVLGAQKRKEKLPTHELLNQRRREIGQALNKKTGPFKDQETGILKAVYGRLKEDQAVAAKDFGAQDIVQVANDLVIQRKQLEDNLTSLLGRDLSGSIMPKVGGALKSLQKGEVKKWDETMGQIPNNIREEIVVSSLNDIFKSRGINGQAFDATQFSKFMNNLDRQPAIKKRLYKELPEESKIALNNLHTVAKGISRAQGDKITTGRISALFDDQGGLLNRMMGRVARSAAMASTGSPLVAESVGDFLSQRSIKSKSVSDLLSSPQFQNVLRTSVAEGVVEGGKISRKLKKAEETLEKSKKYQRWANTLSESQRARLASLGLTSYLLTPEVQQ